MYVWLPKLTLGLVVGAVAGAAAACAAPRAPGAGPAPGDPAEVVAVRAARAAWNGHAVARDTAGIRPLVADSVRVVSPYTALQGREAYVAELGGILLGREQSRLHYTPTAVEVSHALGRSVAAERGTWRAEWVRAGEPTAIEGPYFVTWERRDGRWQMVSEAFIVTACTGVTYCRR